MTRMLRMVTDKKIIRKRIPKKNTDNTDATDGRGNKNIRENQSDPCHPRSIKRIIR